MSDSDISYTINMVCKASSMSDSDISFTINMVRKASCQPNSTPARFDLFCTKA